MPYIKPVYSRNQVDDAGDCLIDVKASVQDKLTAIEVIDNWRQAHNLPMNTLYMVLKKHANHVDTNHLTAQRSKRLHSIRIKLENMRDKGRLLKLSEMQDIGGCRSIVKDLDAVKKLQGRLSRSRMLHKLDHIDDYIEEPKRKSGYRGVHLIFKYQSGGANRIYNNQKIEIQLRTPLQHAWATAVETVDAFENQKLKSNRGDRTWERFFKLMAAVISQIEKSEPPSDTPSDPTALQELLNKFKLQIAVIQKIADAGRVIPKLIQTENAYYFLVVRDSHLRVTTVTGFSKKDLNKASKELHISEQHCKDDARIDAVLVSVKSIKDLYRIYPNYFEDMKKFSTILNVFLESGINATHLFL